MPFHQSKTHNLPSGISSEILWHFTGGPKWNKQKCCQQTKPKTNRKASEILLSILRTRELRVGNYHEIVRVCFKPPKYRKTNILLHTEPVCCVTDIPRSSLHYHAQRYGLYAIGFHRHALLNAGFHPVFYTLNSNFVLQEMYGQLDWLNSLAREGFDLVEEVDKYVEKQNESDLKNKLFLLNEHIDDLGLQAHLIRMGMRKTMAFVKTFGIEEFDTTYSEREWRSTSPLCFNMRDVAMLILPDKTRGGGFTYHEFLTRIAPRLKLPNDIAIRSWSNLVNP